MYRALCCLTLLLVSQPVSAGERCCFFGWRKQLLHDLYQEQKQRIQDLEHRVDVLESTPRPVMPPAFALPEVPQQPHVLLPLQGQPQFILPIVGRKPANPLPVEGQPELILPDAGSAPVIPLPVATQRFSGKTVYLFFDSNYYALWR